MAKFDLVSDLHLDHFHGSGAAGFEELERIFSDPQAPTLLVAGDIGLQNQLYSAYFFTLARRKYDQIICVLGNHDFWTGNINNERQLIDRYREEYRAPNISFLSLRHDTAPIRVDDTVVLGGTLWSRLDPDRIVEICSCLNDFQLIDELSFEDYNRVFESELAQLDALLHQYENDSCLVLTHHAPTFQTTPQWTGSALCSCFCTSLENFIVAHPNIKVWAYGHAHERSEIRVGDAVLVENSYGYYRTQQGQGYKPKLLTVESSSWPKTVPV